ncbi:MAG: FmdB family zinc ribbon protein, partial [Streptosporangiaceae bacterium]
MPIYQLHCPAGHAFEVIQSFTAPLPPCRECGLATAKVPSVFGFAGQAERSLPSAPEAMPQTWRGTYGGNAEYVDTLRRTAERRRALEDRHPELAGDRRPVLAHEGRYESAPLRRGDQAAGGPRHATAPGRAPGQARAHGHRHGPGDTPDTSLAPPATSITPATPTRQ